MNIGKVNQNPILNSALREKGKVRLQQHNKDRMGSRSGPMTEEDSRRDKYGSKHNQDAHGLESAATKLVRGKMQAVRRKQKRRSRVGSRK